MFTAQLDGLHSCKGTAMSKDQEEERRSEPRDRNKSRDNDNVSDPLPPDYRAEVMPDTKFEARGKARRNMGNTAQGTAADPTGPEGNDKTRGRSDK
jgi:hypothetical protein